MLVKGIILDATNNQPLAGTSIVIVDHNGANLGVGIAADGNGQFTLDSPLLDQGNQLLITNVAYQTALVDPDVFNKPGYSPLSLTPDATMLNAVVVTPSRGNWGLAFLIVGILDAIIFSLPVKKTGNG
jgi:hypothetical protein